LSFAGGLFWALSMPGFNLGWLAWIGFIPLLLIINRSKSFQESMLYASGFGLGFNLLNLNWFLGLHPLTWMGLSTINSFLLTRWIWLYVGFFTSYYFVIIGVLTYSILKIKGNMFLKSFLIALCWALVMNKLTSIGEFAFPWSMIEYSQYLNLPLLQFAQYIGGIGIGFIIIFTNSLLTFIICGFLDREIELKPACLRVLAVVTAVIFLHIGGLVLLHNQSKPDKNISATIIQGNVSVEKEKTDLLSLYDVKDYYIKQIKKAPSGLIVIPEAAIYDLLRFSDKEFYNKLVQIAQKQNKTVIVGTVDTIYNKSGELAPTNAAIVLDKIHQKNNIYNKQHLVPFGEYTPEFLKIWVRRIAPTATSTDYYPGNKTMVIPTSLGNVAPNICYEILFPETIKKQVQDKADVIVDLSNLSWFRDSSIKDQFVAFGALRAAESRRPLILSVNTGRSVIIGFNGKILKEAKKNSDGIINEKIEFCSEKSFFSKSIF
jgi:apolipoprotein N-acyltransferase